MFVCVRVCMYMYIYIHVYISICIYIYVHRCIHVYTCMFSKVGSAVILHVNVVASGISRMLRMNGCTGGQGRSCAAK